MDSEQTAKLLVWWDELNPDEQRNAMLNYAASIERLTVELMVARNNLVSEKQKPAAGGIPEFPKIEGVSLELETQLLSWWVSMHGGLCSKVLEGIALLLQERDLLQEEAEILRENNFFLREWVARQLEIDR